MEKAVAVLLLGGSSTRYQREKAFETVDGEELFIKASRPFEKSGVVERLVYVVRKDLIGKVRETIERRGISLPCDLVQGGDSREESAKAGITLLWPGTPALVHDACRPFLSAELVKRVYDSIEEGACTIPGINPREAVYSLKDGGYIAKKDVVLVETPEGFYPDDFLKAYKAVGPDYPDEGSLFLAAGLKVKTVEGEPGNGKVTFPGDL